jgi:hypothetical protein
LTYKFVCSTCLSFPPAATVNSFTNEKEELPQDVAAYLKEKGEREVEVVGITRKTRRRHTALNMHQLPHRPIKMRGDQSVVGPTNPRFSVGGFSNVRSKRVSQSLKRSRPATTIKSAAAAEDKDSTVDFFAALRCLPLLPASLHSFPPLALRHFPPPFLCFYLQWLFLIFPSPLTSSLSASLP